MQKLRGGYLTSVKMVRGATISLATQEPKRPLAILSIGYWLLASMPMRATPTATAPPILMRIRSW